MRSLRSVLLRSILFCLIIALPVPAFARNVSVSIASGRPSLLLTSAASIVATDGTGRRTALGNSVSVRYSGQGRAVVGKHTLRLPVALSGKSPVAFDGRRYRGELRIVDGGGSLRLVNVLDVEQYLRGVLKMEANPAWPMEALKAQAIVSRTYALRAVEQNAGKGGHDLGNTALSQAYRGMNAEDPRTDEDIAKTKGMVVLYGGQLALTPFHSDSGGGTAEVSTVWGGSVPYLRAVREDFQTESPYRQWEARVSHAQVEQALRQAGVDIGRLHSLGVGDVDSFGRVNSLVATGSRGSATVRSHAFRMAVGSDVIRSTRFSIDSPGTAGRTNPPVPAPRPTKPQAPKAPAKGAPVATGPMTPDEERQLTVLTEQGAFNSEELMDMLLNPGKRKGYLQRALGKGTPAPATPVPILPSPSAASGSTYLFKGRGWGHGVGMSQWGAKALADQGWRCERIVQFYFPGTALGRR